MPNKMTSKEQMMGIIKKGLIDRCNKSSEWKGYNSSNEQVQKIKYILNHSDDGWGCIAFNNGSNFELTTTVKVKGENVCKIYWKDILFTRFRLP